MTAQVRLVRIKKCYKNNPQPAIAHVDLSIAAGEFFVLLGPSGCGKSTLLRVIAGLEEPTSGEVHIGEDLVNYTSPTGRNIAMVFQNYALYPHMSARDNIKFPLKMRHMPKNEVLPAVMRAAEMLGLDETLLRRPVSELSGGQRQRVALARAIVRRPRVMLMDEPLSNLDAVLRQQTREELLALHRSVPTTMVYVTHDQVEAMTMGDRIGVMNDGRIIQVGTPTEVYDEPVNRFVGGFVGSPPMNFLSGTIEQKGTEATFVGNALSVSLPAPLRERVARGDQGAGFELGIRPEAIAVVPPPAGEHGQWRVEAVEQLGAERIILLRAGADLIRSRAGRGVRISTGDDVGVAVKPEDAHLFSVTDEDAWNVLYTPQTPAAESGDGGKPVTEDLRLPSSAQARP